MLSRLVSIGVLVSSAVFGQNLIVTAKGHDGAAPPRLDGDDISVEIDHHPAQVCDWADFSGDRANLQLYIAIDDSTDTNLGLQYGDLKSFMNSLPPGTRIGLAYLHNGMAEIVAPLTSDPERVEKALRLTMSERGVSASPYMAISDLIKKWPGPDSIRREILYVGSGIDPYSPHDPFNLYLQNAIADAQRADIPVYSIYFGQSGRIGRSFGLVTWGQNYLSELAEGTGGEAYWQGNINPVSLAPFLKEFTDRLNHQYLLTVDFDGHVDGHGGRLEPVRISTTRAGVTLMAASKIRLGQ
jgi:hypothetical protein